MAESAVPWADDTRPSWVLALCGVGGVILLMAGLFWSGGRSAVSLWVQSSAYNHCFLILPVFFYMVWFNRAELRGLVPRPTLWGGGVILGSAGLWLLSHLSGVAEGVQFAIVGMVQGVLLTVLGGRIYLQLLLPFCYLWLLVPSGESLVPGLQLVTARAAAWLLDLVGIATFLDGIGIEVPSGAYLVAPGCAGLNFVLAALATSVAFAEMIYRSWRRRVAFVLAMLVLAVVGNALRVFLIIAIAHATNNVGNIADDHIVYGWAFFSVLLLGAMALGQRYRQDPPPPRMVAVAVPPVASASILRAAALSAVLVAAAPALAGLCWPAGERPVVVPPLLSCGSSELLAASPEWPAVVDQVDGLASIDCGRDGRHVHLAVAILDRPVRLGKLIGVERWVAAGGGWSRMTRLVTVQHIGGRSIPVQVDLEIRGSHRRRSWSLFWAGDAWRRPGLRAAMADLRADLAGHRRAVLVLAATEADMGDTAADEALRTFLEGLPLARLTTTDAGGD